MSENNYLNELMKNNYRDDGRKLDEYREIEIETNIVGQANGSARVKIGKTEVIAGVKFGTGAPYPDTPNEGMFMVNMELHPMANPDYSHGPPSPEAIEISRVIDRAIRESKTVNFEDLCIREGELAWSLSVDIYPINADGNLFDAGVIAALLAIKNAKFPEIDPETDKVLHDTRTDKGLTLQNIPAMVTIAKIGDNLIVDPSYDEEKIMDARIHIATIDNGNICAMQKGGSKSMKIEELKNAIELSGSKGNELRKLIKSIK
ncbi:MAG: exosome complex protein Rrp42 [Candidatus Woesearchaeota archaeon]